MKHHTHPAIAKRLKRAQGHLARVIEMIDAGQPCVELAQQLYAVESALTNAKRELIHDHIEHCLTEGASGGGMTPDKATAEFKVLARYL